MTNDNDLILRGDALDCFMGLDRIGDIMDAIAALPAAPAPTVKVKPLVWVRHPMGWIAGPPTGQAYIIDVRIKGRVMFIKGMNPPPQFSNEDEAKAAAQADYEARILAAIEVTP